mmetsp:Transcript_8132/g.34181  ORF Transcript_8132/g.34181 Transcript_8132/m.34181 type:complete len:190 (-) Transcript_8132:731-1300(-)
MQSFERGLGRRQQKWYRTPAALVCYGFLATCFLCFLAGLWLGGGAVEERTLDARFSNFQYELMRKLELDDDVYRLEEEIAGLRSQMLGYAETAALLESQIETVRKHIDSHNRFQAAGRSAAKNQIEAAEAQGLTHEADPCAVFKSSLSLCANDVRTHTLTYDAAVARAREAGHDVTAIEMVRNGEEGYF